MGLGETIDCVKRRWPEVASPAQDEPVFILAAGWRSGSTLLQRMLLGKCLVWGEPYGQSGIIGHLAAPLGTFSDRWPEEEALITLPRWEEPLGKMWTANLYPPMQTLLEAHVEFFRKLFAEPSLARGYGRWGLKEVRYGMDHAIYLHWLFPRAKFLFLVRNPYECWASYRRSKVNWVRFHPEPAVTTPEQFGAHWCGIVGSCLGRFAKVNGFGLHYEQLINRGSDLSPLEAYLGFELDVAARDLSVGGAPPGWVSGEEVERLHKVVGPLAARLGYSNPQAPGA